MNAYDSWLEEPYQSEWNEEDDSASDPRQEFYQDEYLTDEELLASLADEYFEEQYVLSCALDDAP